MSGAFISTLTPLLGSSHLLIGQFKEQHAFK